MERSHEPPSHDPTGVVALGPGARVRDRTDGASVTSEAWIAARMAAESRTFDECREALLSAIGRGDVTIERSGGETL